jgi:hypothetical protein
MRSDALKYAALSVRFEYHAQLALLQVPEAAMNEPAGP